MGAEKPGSDDDAVRAKVLEAADRLYYTLGIQAVGMDALRAEAGVSLKRLYQLFPAKEQLVEAYLERRDIRWRERLTEHVDGQRDPERRILAVFDWLGLWFAEPDFRGCAWINSYGELGATSERVAAQVRAHKAAFRTYLAGLVSAAELPAALGDHLFLLAEGAMVTAGITRSAGPAAQARAAARLLLESAR